MPFEKKELIRLYNQVASEIVKKKAEQGDYLSPYDDEVMGEALKAVYNAGEAYGMMRAL